MASYLSVPYQGAGATLYAVIRKSSDWTVFNGSGFEVWADGNLSTYSIALTDQGGDVYAVMVPAALTAGDYEVDFYEQAGGAPATTDLRLTGETFHWDGATLSDTSTITLSAYALTSLDDQKTYQGITASTNDTVLTLLINQVSAQIERIAGIQFKAREYRERIDGRYQRRVILRRAPVQRMNKIVFGWGNALTVQRTASCIDATASVYDDPETAGGSTSVGGLRLISTNTSGVQTATNLSFATYASVSTLVTAINLVSGWSATTLNNVSTADLYATGGENAQSRVVTLRYPDRTIYSYRLDAKTGTLEFDLGQYGQWFGDYGNSSYSRRFPMDFQGVTVVYRAGYETIPADVQMLCNDLVKEMYLLRTQNTALQSYTIGPYSVTFAQLNSAQQNRVAMKLSYLRDGAALVGGAF